MTLELCFHILPVTEFQKQTKRVKGREESKTLKISEKKMNVYYQWFQTQKTFKAKHER